MFNLKCFSTIFQEPVFWKDIFNHGDCLIKHGQNNAKLTMLITARSMGKR